ncbi:hypothetical protein GOP47_0007801 [Adiantum capillus-veneris]|uniref:Uncharacterized protein n=1 Tax=Adiantum capillus-veneris TaxID=13818 RepID=A0A9D4ZLA7_ADICA|nr:hypothetical protein GOP47_0007801 [Adiantum capillus-veneris]
MALPAAFQLDPQAAASHVVLGDSSAQSNSELMGSLLKDALTPDPQITGEHRVTLSPETVWPQLSIFQERGLVLFFTGKLPAIQDIARNLDGGFQHPAVDKIF